MMGRQRVVASSHPGGRVTALPGLLIASLLAAFTGLALLAAGTIFSESAQSLSQPDDRTIMEVTRRFYAGVDDALRTGDIADLEAIIAADFIDHTGEPTDRGHLLQTVKVLHDAAPEISLEVDDLFVSDDRASVRLHLTGNHSPSFLGLDVRNDAPAWGPLEMLRIANGLVVERWTSRTEDRQLQPLLQVSVSSSSRPSWITVQSIDLAPATPARLSLSFGATHWLVVDSGSITVKSSPISPIHDVPTSTSFGQGDQAPLLEDVEIVSQDGGARLILVSLAAINVSIIAEAPPLVVVSSKVAIRTDLIDRLGPLSSDAQLAVGRILLGSGGSLDLGTTPGTVLAAIGSGAVHLATAGGSAWIRHTNLNDGRSIVAADLSPDDHVLLGPGVGTQWRASPDQPATILIVTAIDDGDLSAQTATPLADR